MRSNGNHTAGFPLESRLHCVSADGIGFLLICC